MTNKKDPLNELKLTPFYILKKGDLVRVKEFAREMTGMVGIVLSREDYNTACKVLFSNGVKRTMMKFALEKIDEKE